MVIVQFLAIPSAAAAMWPVKGEKRYVYGKVEISRLEWTGHEFRSNREVILNFPLRPMLLTGHSGSPIGQKLKDCMSVFLNCIHLFAYNIA